MKGGFLRLGKKLEAGSQLLDYFPTRDWVRLEKALEGNLGGQGGRPAYHVSVGMNGLEWKSRYKNLGERRVIIAWQVKHNGGGG